MSITQEPPAIEVLCFQCSGIGKLRITFGDPPQWAKCGKCGGTGKLHRSGGSFVGALPDLSAVVLEEKRGKRKNFEQCGVESRNAHQTEASGRKATVDSDFPDMVANASGESKKPGENQVRLASYHCSIPLCQSKVAMIHEGGRYCAAHGKEKLMANP